MIDGDAQKISRLSNKRFKHFLVALTIQGIIDGPDPYPYICDRYGSLMDALLDGVS